MSIKETTQFSMVEFQALGEAEPSNDREGYMAILRTALANPEDSTNKTVERLGGLGNIQRVRVMGGENGRTVERFEFVTKLPLSVLERQERQRQAKAEAALRPVMDAVLVELALMSAMGLLRQATEDIKHRKQLKAAETKRRREEREWLLSPDGKRAAYDEALRQDRAQRKAALKAGPRFLKVDEP